MITRLKKHTFIILMLIAIILVNISGCGAKKQSSDKKTTENTTDELSEHPTDSLPDITVNVGSLKGPTSMGLVNLMAEDEAQTSKMDYEFNIYVQPDEIVAEIVKGNLDIATVPANLASVLYNKTDGKISVIDINTLGVLYIIESGNNIKSISDLKGKTIYLTGKGTSPDYVLQYLLAGNNLTANDVTLEYKSEATEVASILAENNDAIGLLPQPFVTTAMMNNDKLHIALDMTKEWKNVAGSDLLTGVTIVRNEFLSSYPEVVKTFISEHKASVEFGSENPDETCARIEKYDIIKAPVAKKAYEYCNIVCISGEEMKSAIDTYLNVLFNYDPGAVGGEIPGDNFYATHIGE